MIKKFVLIFFDYNDNESLLDLFGMTEVKYIRERTSNKFNFNHHLDY